jgi:hypothetical protein
MDDAKEHPPPGANRGRASKERSENRTASLSQPHDRRQHGLSRALDAALYRDRFRLNPPIERVRRRRGFYYRLSGPLALAFGGSGQTTRS